MHHLVFPNRLKSLNVAREMYRLWQTLCNGKNIEGRWTVPGFELALFRKPATSFSSTLQDFPAPIDLTRNPSDQFGSDRRKWILTFPSHLIRRIFEKNFLSGFSKNFFLSLLSFWLQSSKEWTRDKSLMAPNFSVRLFNALSLKLLSLSFVSLLFSHIHIHTHSYSFTHSYTYSCTRSPMHVHAPRQSSIL